MKEEIHVERPVSRVAPARVRRASWGAIFAGVSLTLVLQFMLTLLGVAIGVAAAGPSQDTEARTVALGSGLWFLVTGLVSIWVGSCVAGRLSGGPRRADGMLHGLVTWSVCTVVTFFLLATAVGAVLGGLGALVGQAMPSMTSNANGQSGVAAVQQGIQKMVPEASGLLQPTGRTEGGPQGRLTQLATQDPELAGALGRLETQGGVAGSPQDRDEVVRILTTKHNMPEQEASSLVDDWDKGVQQAQSQLKEKAKQVGNSAAKGIGQGAFWGFLALLLGLLASAWGGWVGAASLPRQASVT